MSIELGTVQTGTGKIVPARKFNCTQAARGMLWGLLPPPSQVKGGDYGSQQWEFNTLGE